jgi:hypothetical protein
MKERTAIKINTDRLLTYLTKIPNDGAGDCFFHSFVQANIPQSMFGKFRMKNITVGSLRNLVSELITMQDFRDYNRQQWEIYVAERGPHFPTTESKRATYYLKNMYRDVELSQREHIIQLILSENENPKPDTQLINDLVNDLLQFQDGYFEKFKAYIKTNLYWADSLAINKLRDALNIQFIIFDSKYKQITNLIKFEGPPRRFAGYVMIWWTSPVHYELLQYESKGFFTFQTLPPLIKQLVNANVINCPNCNDDANFLQQS